MSIFGQFKKSEERFLKLEMLDRAGATCNGHDSFLFGQKICDNFTSKHKEVLIPMEHRPL